MKFKFIAKIFILFLALNNSSFASPFDIEGVGDDTADDDRNDAAIHSAEPKQDEISTLQSQPLDKNSEEENKSEDTPKRFQELSAVKLKIVNIHSGKKSDLEVKLGEKTTFDGITINLEKCYKTLDDSYNKISIAYVSLIGSDLKKHSITLSSDLALSTVIASKYIVRADCT